MLDGAALKSALARVELLLLDVDGVLTDGGLYYFGDQGFAVRFHVHDGLGLARAARAGLTTGIVSAREHPETKRRAAELGVQEVHLGVSDKRATFHEIRQRRGLKSEQCCFIGDDLVDLGVLAEVGVPVAVSNAVPAVRQRAAYVTLAAGGNGAVREVIDLWIEAKGLEPL